MTSHRSRNDLIFGRRSSNFYDRTTQLKKEKEEKEEEEEEKRRTVLAILIFPHGRGNVSVATDRQLRPNTEGE